MQTYQPQVLFKQLEEFPSVFKIFGFAEFSFELAYAESKADWSAFYTQWSPEHSMRYLTKKWDDGAESACLVRLELKKSDLRVVTVRHPSLNDPTIAGQQKAELVKEMLRTKMKLPQGRLMETLGRLNCLLQCVDAEQPELIFPHSLVKEEYLKYQTLLRFEKSSDGLLRTLKYQVCGKELEDSPAKAVTGEAQFQPYLILKEPEVQSLLKMLIII